MSDKQSPTSLWWAPEIPIQYTEINSVSIRYILVGQGPALVLLHTLRTQLDIFHKIIPSLQESFTVYALDYPGHGYSDIPPTDYTPQFFADSVDDFLNDRQIEDALVVGVSIGASIALMLAARKHHGINRVVAINPFDYRGGGVGRGNFIASIIFTGFKIPVINQIFMVLNNPFLERKVFEGGVVDNAALSRELLLEMYSVGKRPGYSKAFLNLVKHINLWNEIKRDYEKIEVPTLLSYGDRDWATESERAATRNLIPEAKEEAVKSGGHFLVLDQPERVVNLIKGF